MLQMTAERAKASKKQKMLSPSLSSVTLHCKSMRMGCRSKYSVHVYVVHVSQHCCKRTFFISSLHFTSLFTSFSSSCCCCCCSPCLLWLVWKLCASICTCSSSCCCCGQQKLLSAALLMVAPFYFEINKVAKRA